MHLGFYLRIRRESMAIFKRVLYVSDVHVLLETGAITEQKDTLTSKVMPGHRADNQP